MKYLLALLFILSCFGCKSDPKPGEIWSYNAFSDGGSQNPFLNDAGTVDSIIDVKDGWVEFYRQKWGIKTQTVRFFKIDAHCIKPIK